MKILLVYPKVQETFWSFKHALQVLHRKAAFPPLGALTVAAMLPESWEKRLVDMNVRPLLDKDLLWADYVFISAMIAQKGSARQVMDRCRNLGARTVCGGPLFLSYRDDYLDADHLVLGEGEITVKEFVADVLRGTPRKVYETDERPSLDAAPIPLWDIIDMRDYASMCIQFSRGCPFNCEFCDIIVMNGRVPRTKTEDQMVAELDALYRRGWRGRVFIVDDNFIGNKKKVKNLLPRIIAWQNSTGRRMSFFTEASVDLAEDEELMDLMVAAGFSKVFLGLETPSEESLRECGKSQNLKRGLSESVRIIQSRGLAVMGGFIIGFDNDPPDIFQRQVNFIQGNGIVTAMIGLLTAVPGTRLYKRLEEEGRLLFKPSGDNTDVTGSLNFVPRMDRETIVKGYQWVMNTIYSPEMYYKRIIEFLNQYRPKAQTSLEYSDMFTFLRSIWYLGFADASTESKYYWRLLTQSVSRYRKSFADAVAVAIHGYHFRKLFHDKWIPLDWDKWFTDQNLPTTGSPRN